MVSGSEIRQIVREEIHQSDQNPGTVFLSSIVLNSATVGVGTLVLSNQVQIENYISDSEGLQNLHKGMESFISFCVVWFLVINGIMYLKHGWFGIFINSLISLLFIYWFYGSFRKIIVMLEKRLEQDLSINRY